MSVDWRPSSTPATWRIEDKAEDNRRTARHTLLIVTTRWKSWPTNRHAGNENKGAFYGYVLGFGIGLWIAFSIVATWSCNPSSFIIAACLRNTNDYSVVALYHQQLFLFSLRLVHPRHVWMWQRQFNYSTQHRLWNLIVAENVKLLAELARL